MAGSLWGDEFVIPKTQPKAKKVLEKVNKPKAVKERVDKVVKSKTISDEEKVAIVTSEVYRILGHYKENTQVIRSYDDLVSYIDAAIKNGVIAVDTETNNSLEPITCKLMGGCIYTPGQKNAYIPVNHVDGARQLLPNQLTESQIKEQFERLHDTKIIMHNGKFDYEVIKCTCNCVLDIYWDTLIAAKVLDENELAGLKEQYRMKIDASQEKYDIEHLFDKMEYAIFDPEVFALYAATDAYMTYKLYEWQVNQFKLADNQRLYSLFRNVEMPVVQVAAEMELTGTCIDKEYAKRLSDKYHGELNKLNAVIDEELAKYSDVIAKWRLTEAANYHPPKKSGEGLAKSKSEQLSTPPQLTSPTQLAILFYDVLDVGVQDKKSPRGTGEDIMLKLQDKYPLCKLILQKRGLEKLIGTYVDKLPQCVCEKDGRLHAHFNQYGAATGRFSSSDPNLQNLPSHRKDIRLLFCAGLDEQVVDSESNTVTLYRTDDIYTSKGWVSASELCVGEALIADDNVTTIVEDIIVQDDKYIIQFEQQ